MAEDQWYAIVEKATGRLHATGTVIADHETLEANGFEAIAAAFNPQDGTKEWDELARQFKDRVPPPVLSPLDAAVAAAERLSLADKAKLRTML